MLRLLAACTCAATAAAEPAITVSRGDVSYGMRWVFVDGDGTRSVAEEEDRRCRLTLQLAATGARIVGWQDAEVQVRTDAGEDLAAPTAAWAADAAPVLALAANARAYRRLERVSGHLTVRHVGGESIPWRLALDRLPTGTVLTVPDVPTAHLTLERRDPGSLIFKLDREAALCLGEITANDADGAVVPIRNRRRDPLPDGQRLMLNLDTAKTRTLLLPRWLTVGSSRMAMALSGLDLGLTVPGLPELRGPRPRGAEGF